MFKSGWLNSWTPAELNRVLGSQGLLPLKAEIKNRPDILKLALTGSSYVGAYVRDQLGMSYDGYDEHLDEKSVDMIEERALSLPNKAM